MKEDKKIEILSHKYLNNLPVESPSIDFSERVMQQVLKQELNSSYFVYQPLISKPVWAVIFCVLTALFSYYIFQNNPVDILVEYKLVNTTVEKFFTILSDGKIPQIPSTMILSILIFSIMALFEISMIKRLFERRFT